MRRQQLMGLMKRGLKARESSTHADGNASHSVR